MIVFWLSLSLLFWGLVHSMLASLGAKALARRLFGPPVDRFYRLAYNLFSGISLLPTVWLLFTSPDRSLYTVPFPWNILLFLGQFLAAVALAAGVLQTGALSFLGLSQLWSPAEPSRLVTTGLYRYVRHPLYTAGLLFIWLSPDMTLNRLVLCSAGTIYIILGAWFEERKLRREYGDSYQTYAAATPMFIPFLKWNKSTR